MKSEPDVWSIDQQKKAGNQGSPWDGVRNYQAAKNLKAMKKGDHCFFYHSNIGKENENQLERSEREKSRSRSLIRCREGMGRRREGRGHGEA